MRGSTLHHLKTSLRFSALRALVTAGLMLAWSGSACAQTADAAGDTLHKLNQSVDALIKKVSPSVVQILVTGYGPLEEGERGSTSVMIGRQRAIGSGFVIDSSGYIVTNAHVATRPGAACPQAT